MTNYKKTKKGFTLMEIVTVVAIIVIVSSAAFVGVAVTVQRAKDSKKLLDDNKGDNFELVARASVREITANAGDAVDPDYYTPDDENNGEPVEPGDDNSTLDENGGDGGTGDGGDLDGGSGGSGGGGGSGDGETGGGVSSTSTPTPSPSPSPSPTPTATPTPIPSGGGRVGSTTGTTAVPGSSCSGNAYNASFDIGADATEFTFYVPFDGITGLGCYTGNCTVTGSGHYYTVKMDPGYSARANNFGLQGNGNLNGLDMTQVKIVSYVPA